MLSKLKKILSNAKKLGIKQSFYRLQNNPVVHFLHIGKTGGSAVKEALKYNLYTKNFKIKLHGHDFRLKDIPAGDRVVFFVRDPIKRFVSGFYSRQRKGGPKYNLPWHPNEEVAFCQFNTPNELALALSHKNRKMQELAVNAMKAISHINSSYWDWFSDEPYFRSRLTDVLLIGFQETLDDSFATLKKILKLPEEIELSHDDVKAHRAPRGLDTHLDVQAIKNLMNWYSNDYEFFEFCKKKSKQVNRSDLY